MAQEKDKVNDEFPVYNCGGCTITTGCSSSGKVRATYSGCGDNYDGEHESETDCLEWQKLYSGYTPAQRLCLESLQCCMVQGTPDEIAPCISDYLLCWFGR